MKENVKVYVLSVVIAELVGVVSAFISRSGMMSYGDMISKVPLSPPAILFPVVWTVLYAFMGISSAKVWLAKASKERTFSLQIYVANLIVNFFWSIIFFNFKAYSFAFVWIILLWVLIILMINSFSKVNSFASKLQIPYALWVTFAAYLNLVIWIYNP